MLGTLAAIAAARTVEVRTAAGVQKMAVESLVGAAVAGEMDGFREIEGLKAMAVVARTCFRVHAGRHRKEGFDFCATAHCQRMNFSEMPALVRRAARETEGVLLW